MEIKTDYYYRSKEGVLKRGGKLVFNRYRILSAEGRELPEKGALYYSSAANDIFKVENDNSTVQSIPINRIITEKEYAASQMEYYVFLTWVNQQKFKWMFKRHLLQQNKTLVHLGLIILLIYFVYQLIQLLTD
jgi:hypothetical protein